MTSTSLQDLKEYYTLCQSLVREDDAVPKHLQITKSLSTWRVGQWHHKFIMNQDTQ